MNLVLRRPLKIRSRPVPVAAESAPAPQHAPKPPPLKQINQAKARKERYATDPEYREAQKERARERYRAQHGIVVAASGDLPQAQLLAKLSDTIRRVALQNGAVRRWPVLTLAETAEVLGKPSQSLSVWINNGQLPPPVLSFLSPRKGKAYHQEEVRIFMEVLRAHESVSTYYRRDHHAVREEIYRRVADIRKSLMVV